MEENKEEIGEENGEEEGKEYENEEEKKKNQRKRMRRKKGRRKEKKKDSATHSVTSTLQFKTHLQIRYIHVSKVAHIPTRIRVSAVIFDDDATSNVFKVSDATKVSISCVSLSKNIPFPALVVGAVGKLFFLSSCGIDGNFLESVSKAPEDSLSADDGFWIIFVVLSSVASQLLRRNIMRSATSAAAAVEWVEDSNT